MEREGPLERITRGIYLGRPVDWVIRNNPRYFMSCVKEWLDISPEQASLFTRISQGGIIPERYIIRETRSKVPHDKEKLYYMSNRDILPNYDFFPGEAPGWWKEYKEKSKDLDIVERVDLFYDYERKETRRLWQDFQ